LGQIDQLSREKANLDDLIKLVDRFLNEQDRSVARLITETTRSKQFAERRDTVAMQGDEVAAFQLLDQSLESKAHWRFFSDRRGEPCPADGAVRSVIQ
jgi:hypothetical protein